MEKEKITKYLLDHDYTKEERNESERILTICQEYINKWRLCPFLTVRRNGQDYISDSNDYVGIISIKKNNGFDYYLEMEKDNGQYDLDCFSNFESNYKNNDVTPFEAFLHFVLQRNGFNFDIDTVKDHIKIISERESLYKNPLFIA